MSRRYEEIRDEAMGLSDEEQSWLADDLLDSLRTDEERAIEREWLEVAQQRLAEIDAGTATTIPAEEAHRRVKAKLRAARRCSSES